MIFEIKKSGKYQVLRTSGGSVHRGLRKTNFAEVPSSWFLHRENPMEEEDDEVICIDRYRNNVKISYDPGVVEAT